MVAIGGLLSSAPSVARQDGIGSNADGDLATFARRDAEAGFDVVDEWGNWDRSPFDAAVSDELIVVARRLD